MLIGAVDGRAVDYRTSLVGQYSQELHWSFALADREPGRGLWIETGYACPAVVVSDTTAGVWIHGMGTKPPDADVYQSGLELVPPFDPRDGFEVAALVEIRQLADVLSFEIGSQREDYHIDLYCFDDGFWLYWNYHCDVALPDCLERAWGFHEADSMDSSHTLRLSYSGDQDRRLRAYVDGVSVGETVLPHPFAGLVGARFFAQSGIYGTGAIDCTVAEFHLGWGKPPT
jgi:hypothetical protein